MKSMVSKKMGLLGLLGPLIIWLHIFMGEGMHYLILVWNEKTTLTNLDSFLKSFTINNSTLGLKESKLKLGTHL